MIQSIPERDWQVFRSLHPLALDRYCQKVLEEARGVHEEPGRSHHERYSALHRHLRRADRDIANAFEDFRRSTALAQIATIWELGVLEEAELRRFSDETREAISRILKLRG